VGGKYRNLGAGSNLARGGEIEREGKMKNKVIYFYRWYCSFCGHQNPDGRKICYMCSKKEVKRRRFPYVPSSDPELKWMVTR
jgi:hypothetical protein